MPGIEITIYAVIEDHTDAGEVFVRLYKARAIETRRQVRVVSGHLYAAWGNNKRLHPNAVHRTPEAAIAAWRKKLERELSQCRRRAQDIEAMLSAKFT